MTNQFFWLFFLVITAVAALYFVIDSTLLFGFFPSFTFSGIESDIRSNWGALGDVVGGFLNPILTFISIILLIKTVNLSKKTTEIAEKESVYNIYYNHLHFFEKSLDDFIDSIGLREECYKENGLLNNIRKAKDLEYVEFLFEGNLFDESERQPFVFFVRELRNILVLSGKHEELKYTIYGRLESEVKNIIILFAASSDWNEAREIKDVISKSKVLSSVYRQSLNYDKRSFYKEAVLSVIS